MNETVFVLNKDKSPLDITTSARARQLLKKKKAIIHRIYPFTIRLKRLVKKNTKNYRLKIDYGSRHTGLAILRDNEVVWLAQLHHRINIKKLMDDKRMYRKHRRNRNTRYRQSRFLNRKRQEGWLPPTLRSRVEQIRTWVIRLKNYIPLSDISYELVKFDTQLLQNPDIRGIEYQQGKLMGYEIREYLLEKFNRMCVYCKATNIPLEIEHVIPKSRGGSNRVSNLTLACRSCNQRKGNLTAEEFGFPKVMKMLKQPLKDAAILNSTRWKVLDVLKLTGLPIECGTGALTKMNRIKLNLPKEHHLDACCIGESTPKKLLIKTKIVLHIQSKGRGSRSRVILNKYGFPRGYYKRQKIFFGFMSGDMVKAVIPKGKYKGTHLGTVACRATGSFDIKNREGKRIAQGCNYKHVSLLQRFDGYSYERRIVEHTTKHNCQ